MIATGQTTTVRDFVRFAFAYAGIKLRFENEGVDEVGIIESVDADIASERNIDTSHLNVGEIVVCVDKAYFRPTEVDLLLGDPTKAEQKLGWKREFNLQDLVDDMMESDLKLMAKSQYLLDGGYHAPNHFE